MYYGDVVWFNARRGFGFLSWEKNGEKQKDMFIHFSGITSDENYKTLNKGQRVSFSIGANHNGDPKAIYTQIL